MININRRIRHYDEGDAMREANTQHPRFSRASMAWVAIGTAVVGAGSSMYGSSQAKKSANKAADTNARSVADTNAANLQMFRDSRGANGSAILPEYLMPYEGRLGTSAARTAEALFNYGGGPEARIRDDESYLRRYNPALEAGDNLVFDLATGQVAQDRRASLDPVLAARSTLAKGRASSINDSLDQMLAGIRASRAKSGFRGASTFDLNRMLASTTGARGAAAEAIGGADLENAMAIQGLDDSNLQMRLSGLDQPFQRAQQRLAFRNLPFQSAADQSSAAMAPLNYFRIGPGQAPREQPFLRPDTGNNGQIFGAGISAAAGSYGNYLANQQLMKELGNYFRQPTPSTPDIAPGTYGDSPYW